MEKFDVEERDVENTDDPDTAEVVHDYENWKNPPKLSDLKADYTEAQSDHSSLVTDIDEWGGYLKGELRVSPAKGRSRVQPKLIRKMAEWRYSALEEPFLSTEDLFNAAPVTAEDKGPAEKNEMILSLQFRRDIDKVKLIGTYVRAAVDTGTTVLKVGWKTVEEEVEEEVEVPVYGTPEESMLMLQQLVQSGQMPPEQADQIIANGEPVQMGTELEMQTVIKEIENKPTVKVIDRRSVIIDPSCGDDFDDAMFVIEPFTTSLSELEEDGRYFNLDKIRPSDNSPLSDDDYIQNKTAFTFSDKPRQKFVAYEYWGFWDIDDTGIVKPFIATWVGDTLVRMEENPFPDKKLPYVVVPYLPVTNSINGEPDAELLKDNQDIIGATTRGMIDIMGRSANGQIGIAKDVLDTTNKLKMEKGKDFMFNPNVDVKNAFHMQVYPEIPGAALELVGMMNNEAESLIGVKAFSGGISGNALGAVATGVRGALDATAKRELGILRRLSNGLQEVGRKVVSMNKVWLSEEEIVRITEEEFIPIRKDDLDGSIDIKLSISTAEADNEKAQELSFMLQTMGNSQDPEITKMIQVEIAKLRKMPDLAKRIQEYQPQPDPAQVKIQELQIAKLEAELFNEQQKGLENQADIALKQAKTQSELAKGRKSGSEADKLDLDFVNDEQGVTHNRNMEKEESKQDSNVALKLLDKENVSSDVSTRI